jgi:fibronectin type 3 domain-containing protein
MKIRLLSIIASLLPSLCIYAQQNDDNTFAGNRAVFVYNAWPAASVASPDATGNTGFILQRRERSVATEWTTLQTFRSPESAGELMDRYNAARRLFPLYELRFDVGEAWRKWKQYKTYDSLLNEVGYPPGQMAFGILLADTTVQAGKTYQYRVLKANETVTDKEKYAGNWVSYPAQLAMPAPRFLRRQTEQNEIILEWSAKARTTGGWFTVYRATGDEKNFRPIAAFTNLAQRGDSIVFTIQDKKVAFSEMYRYYIMPVNAFGGGGNVLSDTIAATCMNPTTLLTPQYISTSEKLSPKAIVIHYLLPDPSYIGSVQVMRSTSFDDGYEEVGLAEPQDSLFTDYRIVTGKKYYYYLLMTDKMGRNSARSIKTFGLCQDTANSFPARFVTAERVPGGVKVSWQNPPDTNVVSGYYVCRSAGGSESFERITTLLPLQDSLNSYVDTSSLLQAATLYAYSVVSENTSNKVSGNSMIAYITPAAAAAPTVLLTPQNVKLLAENKRARLIWYDMRLVNATQAFYNIYRRSDKDTGFIRISSEYPASFTSYLDTTLEAGLGYVYAVEGADAAGHVSAQAITSKLYVAAQALPAPVISAFAAGKTVTVAWEEVADPRVSRYFIYRHARGEEPEKIGEAAASDHQFEDKRVAAGKTYYYYLQADAGNRPLSATASNKVYVVMGE